MDGSGDGAQEAKALLEIPNIGIGKGISIQRIRFKTETLGTGEESEFN